MFASSGRLGFQTLDILPGQEPQCEDTGSTSDQNPEPEQYLTFLNPDGSISAAADQIIRKQISSFRLVKSTRISFTKFQWLWLTSQMALTYQRTFTQPTRVLFLVALCAFTSTASCSLDLMMPCNVDIVSKVVYILAILPWGYKT